jgi:hypothetical protein
MPGLLDLSDEARMALMAAGLGMMGGGPNAISRGGLLGMTMYNQQMRDKQDREMDALRKKMFEAQMAEQERAVRDREEQRRIAEAMAKRAAEVDAGAPRIGAEWNPPAQGYAPAVAEAFGVPAAQPQKAGFDQYEAMIRRANYYANNGMEDKAKTYFERAEKLREKYSLSPIVMLQNGKPAYVQPGEFGGRNVIPGDVPPKVREINRGGQIDLIDDLTMSPLSTLKTTMAPGEAARLGLEREKFGYQKTRDAAAASSGAGGSAASGDGKPPSGYRWKQDGSLEAIPGGPADKGRSEKTMQGGALARADLVIGKVDEATNLVKGESWASPRTGLTGAVAGMVPGTDAYDLRRTAETIKANIGFQELQAMREASPTGGALGQVAVQELNMLQAVIANLDPNQSPPVLLQNLKQARKHMAAWRDAVSKNDNASVSRGATGSFDEPVAAPNVDALVKKYARE